MIDLDINCDNCGATITEGSTVFCFDCFDTLRERISNLEEMLANAEEEIEGLKENTPEPEAQIMK